MNARTHERTSGLAVGLVIVWASALAGCAPTNREELAKEALRADPEFKATLEKYRELANRIQTHQRELALKRSTIEQNIGQLRKDLAAAASSTNSKIDEVKKRMDPDRQRLLQDLQAASEEWRIKREQRAHLGRSIAELKKALGANRSTWTAQDHERRTAQMEEMLQDARRLDQEMATLKEHMRLLKIKLLLIKF